MVLTVKDRKQVSDAMRVGLTPAQRVQQRLNAERIAKLPESLSVAEAAIRLSNEARKLEIAMCREDLEVADSHVGLLFANTAPTGEQIGVVWSHGASMKIGPIITKLEGLEAVSILGLVWGVLDRQAGVGRMWARPLVSGEHAAARLQLAQNMFKLPRIIK
ncbi:MAG TPA: hypothetical protein VGR47_00115 [Terracidiphilus sp.]|nr:hypothetical protein [Terracidiphilus sp.]